MTEGGCDDYSRLLVRMREVGSRRGSEASVSTSRRGGGGPHVRSNVPRTLKPDDGTEVYRAVEGAKGELGIYIRADGTAEPARFEIRGSWFSNLQTLPELSEGEYVPDLIASLGSLDTSMDEVHR